MKERIDSDVYSCEPDPNVELWKPIFKPHPLEFDIKRFTDEINKIEVIIAPFLNFGTNVILKFTNIVPTKFDYRNEGKSEEDQVTDDISHVTQIPFVILNKNEVDYIKNCIQHNKYTKLFVHLINFYLSENCKYEFIYGKLHNVEFVYLTPENSNREILSTEQFIFYTSYSHQLFPNNVQHLTHTKETRRMFYKQFGTVFERVRFIKYDPDNETWTDYNCKTTLEMMKRVLSCYNSNQKRYDGCTTIYGYLDQLQLPNGKTREQLMSILSSKSKALGYGLSHNSTNSHKLGFYYCSTQDNKQFRKLQNWVKKQWKNNRHRVVSTVIENTFIVCYKETMLE